MVQPRAFLAAAAVALATPSAVATAAAEDVASRVLPDVTLALAQGGTARVVQAGDALTALVFFRTGHDRSTETLRMLSRCRPRLAQEPLRLVGVVPADSAPAAPGLVQAAGLDLPLLVDAEDALYAAAGVRTHPAIVLVDRARRVVVLEPFHQVDYCDVVVARVQRALGKIGDAQVARVLAPAATQLPGDAPGAVAHRHVALARRLLAARSFAPAHENARKAIALAPSADAWRVEGEVFAAEGRCPDAVRAFEAALALDPRDAAASAARRSCGR
jgi:tetratricopeptide (TPR) repeat protein